MGGPHQLLTLLSFALVKRCNLCVLGIPLLYQQRCVLRLCTFRRVFWLLGCTVRVWWVGNARLGVVGVGGCSIQGLGVGWSVGQQRWSCVATLTLTLSYSTPPPFTLLWCQLLSFSRSYNPKYPFTIVLRLPLYKHHILPPPSLLYPHVPKWTIW